jgi:hypothetical protein
LTADVGLKINDNGSFVFHDLYMAVSISR